jgi:uncharacterized protein YdhG (YjbR/CyaY superfamily)
VEKAMAIRSEKKEVLPAKDVAEYIAKAPKESRDALERLRGAIKAAAPKAVEVIKYRVPTYKQDGWLVFFAAHKNHLSFIVVSKAIMKTYRKELEPYNVTGTTIHFSAEKQIPLALVKKIVKIRLKENQSRVK